jgi:hypothetical protein
VSGPVSWVTATEGMERSGEAPEDVVDMCVFECCGIELRGVWLQRWRCFVLGVLSMFESGYDIIGLKSANEICVTQHICIMFHDSQIHSLCKAKPLQTQR